MSRAGVLHVTYCPARWEEETSLRVGAKLLAEPFYRALAAILAGMPEGEPPAAWREAEPWLEAPSRAADNPLEPLR